MFRHALLFGFTYQRSSFFLEDGLLIAQSKTPSQSKRDQLFFFDNNCVPYYLGCEDVPIIDRWTKEIE
jgi:hypothetical protein